MQDLNARIQLEHLKLDNERMKLEMVKTMQDAADKMNQQNASEQQIKQLDTITPIKF